MVTRIRTTNECKYLQQIYLGNIGLHRSALIPLAQQPKKGRGRIYENISLRDAREKVEFQSL